MSSKDFKADSSAPGYLASVLVPSRRAIQLPGTNWVVWQNHVVGEHGRSVILGSEPAAVYLWRLPSREGFTGLAFERDLGVEGVHWHVGQSLPLY